MRKVDYTKKGHLAYVTIRNAEHENCLEEEVDHDLWKVWHDFRDDPGLYVAILTGEGTKSFCAGSDLRASFTDRSARAFGRALARQSLRDHASPTHVTGLFRKVAMLAPPAA